MEGKFSLKYFLFGKGKESWFKTLGYGWRLLVILLVAYIVWRAFFMKTQTQKTTFTGPVGKVNIIQERKKTVIPFVEGSVGQSNRYKMETTIKAGIRCEF